MPADPEFERFWRFYPRKKSKGDAMKAWRQTAGDRPELESLLLALERSCREWKRRDAKYIPYPATWIRALCWEDEPDPEPDPMATMDPISREWARINGLN